jgi:hypothetical protein
MSERLNAQRSNPRPFGTRRAAPATTVVIAGCLLAGTFPAPADGGHQPALILAGVQAGGDQQGADAPSAPRPGAPRPVTRRVPTLARGHAPPASKTLLPDKPGAAEKMFAGGLTKDFGEVLHGTLLLHRFPVVNVHSAPVTIAYLQPSCECISASAGKRTLQPGESTTIDVRLDAGHFRGPNSQNVRVKIRGPNFESTCKLVLSAVSWPCPAPHAGGISSEGAGGAGRRPRIAGS